MRRKRLANKTKKMSTSILALLIVAAGVLAFVPIPVTLAAGEFPMLQDLIGMDIGGLLQELGQLNLGVDLENLAIFVNGLTLKDTLESAGLGGLLALPDTTALLLRVGELKVTTQSTTTDDTITTRVLIALSSVKVEIIAPLPEACGGDPNECGWVAPGFIDFSFGYFEQGMVEKDQYSVIAAIFLSSAVISLKIDPRLSTVSYVVTADMTVYQALWTMLDLTVF